MLSEAQEEAKKQNILKVAKHFIQNGGSLADVEKSTGIPHSTAQRYLHDKEIERALGVPAYNAIQDKLADNKKAAVIKGGKTFAANNDFIKDKFGKFAGSKKK